MKKLLLILICIQIGIISYSQNDNSNIYLMWEMIYNLHEVMLGEPDSVLIADKGTLVTCKWLTAGENNIHWVSSVELNLLYLDQPAIVSSKLIEPEYQTSNKEDVFVSNKLEVEDFFPPEIEYSNETGELLEVFRHKKITGMVFIITKYKGKYKGSSFIYFPLLYNINEYYPDFAI